MAAERQRARVEHGGGDAIEVGELECQRALAARHVQHAAARAQHLPPERVQQPPAQQGINIRFRFNASTPLPLAASNTPPPTRSTSRPNVSSSHLPSRAQVG